MLENKEWLIEVGTTLGNFIFKDRDLCVLAAKAQDGDTTDIGIACIPGKEGTEFFGNTACLSASQSVSEKLDTIYVWKYGRRFMIGSLGQRD